MSFDPRIIDVAIGLFVVYLALSTFCSAIQEWIAGVFALRSKTLRDGVAKLLNDPDHAGIAKEVYAHGLLQAFDRGGTVNLFVRNRYPSYIPSRTFAIALLDVIAPADQHSGQHDVAAIRAAAAALQNPPVRQALLALIDDAQADINKVRENVANWFDAAMERVSGWYKRRIQVILVVVAFAVVGAANADTFAIVGQLYLSPQLRTAMTAVGVAVAPPPTASTPSAGIAPLSLPTTSKQAFEIVGAPGLPLGWSRATLPGTYSEWVVKLLGLIFSGVLVSFGAPFWFDLLNTFVNLRSSGDEPLKASAPK